MESKSPPSPCSLLIVDDDRTLLRLYEKILKLEGYRVDTALSRDEALEKLRNHEAPDLLLLDCRMAGMSNFQFKLAIEDIVGTGAKPRSVGFSAFPGNSDFAREMREIFGAFLEKPIDLYEFVTSVGKLCAETHSASN